MRFDGIPIVVIRQSDGALKALVNACRHRGAPLVDPVSEGSDLKVLTCPYHAWAYGLDGTFRARPAASAFADVELNCDLHQRPVAEKHGLIFVRPEGAKPIDVDEVLAGAQDDIADFGLGDYVHIETRVSEWDMNWKLALDTFTESYHIKTLHRTTLGPTFNSECVIYEPFGRNCVSIGLREAVKQEVAKPKEQWALLPYGTIQYFLIPNALVVHQLDHVEVWRIEPLSVGRTRLHTAIYAPSEPHSEKARNYFVKNLDLLLHVTGTEDFPMMVDIQANLASGALDKVVYGQIEPPLIHLHTVINDAVERG